MSTTTELLKFLIASNRALVNLLRSHERSDDAPASEPEPEPRKLRQSEQKGVDMNDLRRHCDQAHKRLPRQGSQQRRWSGVHWYWE